MNDKDYEDYKNDGDDENDYDFSVGNKYDIELAQMYIRNPKEKYDEKMELFIDQLENVCGGCFEVFTKTHKHNGWMYNFFPSW